jgi:Fe-S oxidoreductase
MTDPQEAKQNNIQANNLLEEAGETLEQCIKCGMCKSLCPVFKALREERISPRGHSILLQEKILQDSLFECNLCKACEKKCPLNLKICDAILKAREALVLKNKGIESNKEMIKNVRETGNPFGKDPKVKDGKLYCC